jgi:hypothetical protein
MGTILNILEIVDRLTKTTQDRAAKEDKTFKEILDEEIKKLNTGQIDIKA